MSGVDSEQEKQPISSVNGQSGDDDVGSPAKEDPEDHTPPTEGLKGRSDTETTAFVTNHTEEVQSPKEGVNENETKDSQNPEITNGHNENEKEGESSVVENKADETSKEVLDNKQVNNDIEVADVENERVEAEKEVKKAAEQSEAGKSNNTVTAVADGEQNKVETEPEEMVNTVGELKEEAVSDEKQTEEKCENHPSDESKVAVTDPEAADRKRAVTIDNPVDMKELTAKSGESPQKAEDVQERSRTLGVIEGNASSPLKEDVAARSQTVWYTNEVENTPSKPDSAASEEIVSYSTSIVGGVPQKVPISSSPKTQPKPKEGSPQMSASKSRSVIDSLLGRQWKSKGSPESPQRSSVGDQDAEKESQQNQPESTPVAQNDVADTAKADTEPSESGASVEVEDAKSTDADHEPEVKAVTEKEGGDGEIQPAPLAQSEEDDNEEITETKEGDSQEVPVPVEGAEEKGETNAKAPEGEQPEEPKDTIKRAHSDHPKEEETSPQPAAKKKKPLFGGIFNRRKSKKSKGDLGSPPTEIVQEKEGGKPDEKQQDESLSTEPADDAKPQAVEEVETVENSTDQDGPPDASPTTDTAHQEVTEDVISPATDQAVESAKEDIAEEGEQEAQTAAGGEDPSAKEEETVTTESVQKSAEEPVQSTDADGAVEKEETGQQPVPSQDHQAEKKHSFFSGFFGRRKRKKSTEVDAASSAETPEEKSDNVLEQQQGGKESTQATDAAKSQAVVTVETLENGTANDAAPETSDTTDVVQQQEVTEDSISPAVDEAVESAKENTADKEKGDANIGEQEGEAAIGEEPSGKEEETAVPEDAAQPAEEPLQPEDADATVEKKETEEVPVQSQESQPEKKHSIFSGLFGRRKSKKSKGDAPSTTAERPHEEEGDQAAEMQQGGNTSTQAADDSTLQALESEEKQESDVTDQVVPPGNTIDTSATVQQEVTEVVIIPADDQAVESAKDEMAEKVDGNIGEQETTSEQESTGKEIETSGPEDAEKSTEEESEIGNHKPKVEKPSEDTSKETSDSDKPEQETPTSLESEEAEDKGDVVLRERIALTHGSHSPKTHRMQMRISYAETTGEGGREVEVIGTPERVSEAPNQKGKTPPGHRVSCRDLGEADHEGWLAKKGGPLFFSSWKRKWVVLKEGKLYYFKTAFDPEASGVINMDGVTVAQAPETKKNFCFKCEQPGPKPQVSHFMADNKEDMENWLKVLTAASKGEVIQKSKQHHLAPMGEVAMRKKSGSISAQRTSSVLAVGGRHDFLEDEEDLKATRRRSTPGSLSKSPDETEEKDQRTSVSSGTHPVISETHPAPKDTQPVLSDTQEVSEPSEDKPEEPSTISESEKTEKPAAVVDEVLKSSEKIAVESVPGIEVSSQQDTPAVDSNSVEVTTEAESAQPEQESAPDVSDSAVDKTDGAVSIVTTGSSVSVVETVKSTSVISEKVETVVSVVKTGVTEISSAQQRSETGELKQDATKDIKETSPTQPDEPVSPSKTKWYFTLDRQETWSVPPEVEQEKTSSAPKSPGSSSDKVSIKSDRGSIKSDKGSIKSASDDDDLMVMCKNIRKARLSIVGDHMLDGPEKLRALSSVHDGKEESFVKLKTLERTLKDKEKHLSELEELLTQPEINRDSIYAWKSRFSDLVEEFFPQFDEDAQEEIKKAPEGGESETQNKAPEGGESETQNQESSEAGKEELKSSEEEVKGETTEEVAKKSDEEQATTSKDEDEERMEEKQAADEGKEETERDHETVQEETSSEKQEDSGQKEDNNLIVTVEIQQMPAESVSVTDSEQNPKETATEHEKQAQEEETVSNSEQTLPDSQAESREQEDNEDVQDTRL